MADLRLVKKRGPGRPKGSGNKPVGPGNPGPVKTYRNITVDADILDELHRMGDQMEAEFGFRPNLSQTVRWLVKKARKEESP